ncbi:MAG TPA: CRISPR-associated endonuclease Cas1 [Mycobacteriales bacterium]|nr:CRISPR-associated endonuclease Cas1 [Mycobacteriales bacterium]
MPGSRVHIDAGRLVVDSAEDAELLSVPSGHVERLVCFGPVGVSAGARSWALTNQVNVVFASRRGGYLGQLLSSSVTRVDRLRDQLRATDNAELYLPFGRAVVTAKVRKQAVLLQRLVRREQHEEITHEIGLIQQMLAMVPDCGTRDELMGVEGAAARSYFTALGLLVPEELRFSGRSRQPPMDTINSALSFGYTVLVGEATAALVAAGLDPAIGLLHTEQYRRPSLALDLVEEFRPLVIDQVVISAARAAELRPEHGRVEEGRPGVLLTRAGREVLLTGYERRMLRITRGALPGFSGSLRRHLYRQAQRIAAYIADPTQSWTGLSWR